MEQHGFLQNKADLLTQRFLPELPYVGAVDLDRSGNRIVKTRNQADDRSFPGAGGTNQSGYLSGFDLKAHILQNQSVLRVVETHMLELDLSSEARRGPRPWQILHLFVGLQDLLNAFVTNGSLRISIRHLRKFLHRLVHFFQVQKEKK